MFDNDSNMQLEGDILKNILSKIEMHVWIQTHHVLGDGRQSYQKKILAAPFMNSASRHSGGRGRARC